MRQPIVDGMELQMTVAKKNRKQQLMLVDLHLKQQLKKEEENDTFKVIEIRGKTENISLYNVTPL